MPSTILRRTTLPRTTTAHGRHAAMTRLRRRRVLVAALSLGLLAGPVGAASPTSWLPHAAADPDLATARAQAARLAKEVAALDRQAEAASEHLNKVTDELGAVVAAYLTASERLGQLTARRDALRQTSADRVRALYMAGGQAGIVASVLQGGDISDVINRYYTVQRVLRTDGQLDDRATGDVSEGARVAARLDDLAARRARLEDQARTASQALATLAARRQADLATANALVRRLADEARQRAEAEAAARAAAQLGGTTVAPPIALGADVPVPVVTAITAARSAVGKPYVWGAEGPGSFDCSGLVQWAYAKAGLALPRVAADQWNAGPKVPQDQLRPGDLLFWANNTADPRTIHHVAMYLGGGWMVEAPRTGLDVRVIQVYLDGYIGANRPAAAAWAAGGARSATAGATPGVTGR